MPKNEIEETSKFSTVHSLGEWLAILAAQLGKELSPLQIAGYYEGVKDFTAEQIHAAFSWALANWGGEGNWSGPIPMPPVAKLRAVVLEPNKEQQEAQKKMIELQVESEWEAILRHVERCGELVYLSDPPLVLVAAGEYALKNIGWRRGLLDAIDKGNIHFAHKNFVENFVRFQETDGLKALPQPEALKLLGKVRGLIEAGKP